MSAVPTAIDRKLTAICKAVHVVSPDNFIHCGRSMSLNNTDAEDYASSKRTVPLEVQLSEFIYQKYYANLPIGKLGGDPKDPPTLFDSDQEFISNLVEANQGAGFLEPHWTISGSLGKGVYTVLKRDVTLEVTEGRELVPSRLPVEIGDQVAVKFPKHSWYPNSGFYFMFSNEYLHTDPESRVRIYTNVDLDEGIHLVRLVTTELNEDQLPFEFKIVMHPRDFVRYDTAVLYIDRKNYSTARSAMLKVWNQCRRGISPEIPFMTKLLRPGLSVAEEPFPNKHRNESFGSNRCRLIARGLITAYERGAEHDIDRKDLIFDAFHQEGLDISRPYLNPGSADIY